LVAKVIDAQAPAALTALMEAAGYQLIMGPPDPRPTDYPLGRLVYLHEDRAILVAVREPMVGGFGQADTRLLVARTAHVPIRNLDLEMETRCDVKVDGVRNLYEMAGRAAMPGYPRYCGYQFLLRHADAEGAELTVNEWAVKMERVLEFLIARLDPGRDFTTLPVDAISPGDEPTWFWGTDAAQAVLDWLIPRVTSRIAVGQQPARRVLWQRA
jgi:hypothetical protein